MNKSRVEIPEKKMADFCRRHAIKKLSLFGSVLRNDFQPTSDIDVLVEFQSGHVPGFIRLHQIEEEFSALIGHPKIDLVTPKFLNYRIRDQVLAEAQVQYAQR